MKELGRRIRARRAKMGLSQTTLAGRVGRSHGWLSNLEKGRGGETPAEVLTGLAVELGEDPAEYLRLAGRVALTAERIVPAADQTPPWAADLLGLQRRTVELLEERLSTATSQPPEPTGNGREHANPWPSLLRLGRAARGLSQGQLANRVGANARTVERWESGAGDPSLRQQTRIVALFADIDPATIRLVQPEPKPVRRRQGRGQRHAA